MKCDATNKFNIMWNPSICVSLLLFLSLFNMCFGIIIFGPLNFFFLFTISTLHWFGWHWLFTWKALFSSSQSLNLFLIFEQNSLYPGCTSFVCHFERRWWWWWWIKGKKCLLRSIAVIKLNSNSHLSCDPFQNVHCHSLYPGECFKRRQQPWQ